MTDNSGKYCVYKHTSPSQKVYIGITSLKPSLRWRLDGSGYIRNDRHNTYFANAIQKYGWDNFKHEILFENLSKEEAEKQEIELISYYNSTNRDYGYNIQSGGTSGYIFTDDMKKHLSDIHKGKHHTEETKTKMSKSRIGHCVSEETRNKIRISNTGKTASIETRNKMSMARKGNPLSDEHKIKLSNSHKKRVLQYSKNGTFLKEYNSVKDACLELSFCPQNITACCRGINKTAYGYIWRYKEDEKCRKKI